MSTNSNDGTSSQPEYMPPSNGDIDVGCLGNSSTNTDNVPLHGFCFPYPNSNGFPSQVLPSPDSNHGVASGFPLLNSAFTAAPNEQLLWNVFTNTYIGPTHSFQTPYPYSNDFPGQASPSQSPDFYQGVASGFPLLSSALTVPPNGQCDPTFQLPGLGSVAYFPNGSEWSNSGNANIQSAITNPAELPVPAAAPASTEPNTHRLRCNDPKCTKTFARAGDLKRHKKKHSPPEHPCPVDNCDRKGDEAFYRHDKLLDHQRKKHKMTV